MPQCETRPHGVCVLGQRCVQHTSGVESDAERFSTGAPLAHEGEIGRDREVRRDGPRAVARGSASANEVRDETVHLFTAGAVKRRCSQVRDTPVHLGGEEGRHARKHKHVPHLQRPGNRVTSSLTVWRTFSGGPVDSLIEQ